MILSNFNGENTPVPQVDSQAESTSTSNIGQPDKQNVHFIAKESVKSNLSNPDSADFPSIMDIQISDLGGGVWTVLGYVVNPEKG